MTPLFEGSCLGTPEPRRGGVDQLCGDERVGAATDDQGRTGVGAGCRGILEPVIPDVGVAGRNIGPGQGPDACEAIELSARKLRRQLRSDRPLSARIGAEATKRRDRRFGKGVPPSGTGVISANPRTRSKCSAATSSAICDPRLWPTDRRVCRSR